MTQSSVDPEACMAIQSSMYTAQISPGAETEMVRLTMTAYPLPQQASMHDSLIMK